MYTSYTSQTKCKVYAMRSMLPFRAENDSFRFFIVWLFVSSIIYSFCSSFTRISDAGPFIPLSHDRTNHFHSF